MLRERNRLRRAADLALLRQQGRSRRHPLAILLVQANGQDASRFGFIASRRVGNAVTRNRSKRLLREAVRRHLTEVNAGWDCLFIARKQTPLATFAEVEEAVCQLLIRAKLLGEER